MNQVQKNAVVTKKDLEEFETRFENKLDKSIGKRLDASFEAFRKEINYQFQVQNEMWEQRFNAFESRIITVIDPLLKELETRQQDREIATAQMKHVSSDITDLQKRVTKLETS